MPPPASWFVQPLATGRAGRTPLAVLAVVICLFAVPFMASTPAQADWRSEWYDTFDDDTARGMQSLLIWTRHYNGLVDGVIGPNTRRAVAAFQRSIGTQADGLLSSEEAEQLVERGRAARERAGFTLGNDARSGLGLGLPYAFTSLQGEREDGITYRDDGGRFRVNTFRITSVDADDFARTVFSDVSGYSTTYRRVKRDQLVVTGEDTTEILYLRALRRGDELRGFFVWYDKALRDSHSHVVMAIASSLEWGDHDANVATAEPPAQAEPRTQEVERSSAPSPSRSTGSGTAFAVTANGFFVTNAHVVRGCGRLTVGTFGQAMLYDSDETLDLAVLVVPGARGIAPARIADDDPQLAESVFAFGFPLPDMLGQTLGVSRGSVSSLSGLVSTSDRFRMTAAVQPGNSGGPLVDEEGRVVGVVTSKLNAMRVASQTGDIPQAMNFAITGSALRGYLARMKVTVRSATRSGRPQRPATLARDATGYTHQVLCLSQ